MALKCASPSTIMFAEAEAVPRPARAGCRPVVDTENVSGVTGRSGSNKRCHRPTFDLDTTNDIVTGYTISRPP
jgi:hypothetical protein